MIQYEYDYLGRQTAEIWIPGNAGFQPASIQYTYDANNNLLSVTDTISGANYAFTYDSLSRRTSSELDFDAFSTAVLLQYAYDTTNRTTTTTASQGDSMLYQNVYLYSVFGYLTDINQTGANITSKSVTYTYNANGQRVGSTNKQSGETVSNSAWSYDAANRVTSIQHKTATDNIFAEYGFTWDAANRIAAFETNDGTADYTYDATGQLTGADYDYITDETYTYDDNGNRVLGNGDTYATGDNNETVSDGTYNYTYDAEGNRTEKYLWTDSNENGIIDESEKTLVQIYEWDYRNRLSNVTNYENGISEEVVSYLYDYLNQMITRSITADSTTTSESFIYDNGQVVLEYDTSGSVDVVRAVNLWGTNIDELVAVERLAQSTNDSNQILWSYGDHLNSIRDVVIFNSATDTVTVVNHLIYDAFGNLLSSVDPSQANSPSIEPILIFRYTGKYFDDSTGFQNNLNRWYDATTGKWLTVDPIEFSGGDANLYLYVSNCPILFLDFNGFAFYSNWGVYVRAFGEGLVTGGKSVINGAAGAAVSTATLGFSSYSGPFQMTEKDLAYGGRTAQMFAQGGTEILIGAGTGGLASLASNSNKASTAVKVAAHAANVFDAAGNTVNTTRGAYDMSQNGVTLQNSLQVGLGSAGLAGNATPYYDLAKDYYRFRPQYDNEALNAKVWERQSFPVVVSHTPLAGMSNAEKGLFGEFIAREVMVTRGYQYYGDGMYDGYHGIDGIFVNPSTCQTLFVEAKFRTGWSHENNPIGILGTGYGGHKQLSSGWLNEVRLQLRDKGKTATANVIGQAMGTKSYSTVMIVVNENGNIIYYSNTLTISTSATMSSGSILPLPPITP